VTTFTDFNPSSITSPPFQFQATLDGVPYNVSATWNVFGQRWYVTVTALDGTVILTTAIASSPSSFQIESLAWARGQVTAETAEPHGLKVGTVAALTLTGATPDAYNGLYECLVTGPSTFTYDLATDPGAATIFGAGAQNLNMIGGVPNAAGVPFSSTLIFRESSNQFEVSP
jgi:hypothetical protein